MPNAYFSGGMTDCTSEPENRSPIMPRPDLVGAIARHTEDIVMFDAPLS